MKIVIFLWWRHLWSFYISFWVIKYSILVSIIKQLGYFKMVNIILIFPLSSIFHYFRAHLKINILRIAFSWDFYYFSFFDLVMYMKCCVEDLTSCRKNCFAHKITNVMPKRSKFEKVLKYILHSMENIYITYWQNTEFSNGSITFLQKEI